MDEVNYITRQGHRRLAEELQHLQNVERRRVVQEVADAAAMGDRSENAEYIYGKRRLREIDRRLRFLTLRLRIAKVVDPEELSGDTVRFGATVEIENEAGERFTYQVVGVDETQPSEGRISWKSPLGNVLMKRSVGDDVTVPKPDGTVAEYTILSVRFG
jgi:transcription elongation factor GreB